VVINSGQTNFLSSPLPLSSVRFHLDLTRPPTRVDPDLTSGLRIHFPIWYGCAHWLSLSPIGQPKNCYVIQPCHLCHPPCLLLIDQLALVPAFGRQRWAMLILVCWAMLILSCQAMPILFLPGIIRIKPQYLSDILKHFQFQSQKKSMNQIKFLSTSVNTTFVVLVLFCSYWSYYSAWWPVLCACWGEVGGQCNWMREIWPWE